MNWRLAARSVRLLLVACFTAIVFVALVDGLGSFLAANTSAVLMPFVAAAVTVAGLRTVLNRSDILVSRLAQDSQTTPYAALAEAAVRIREGSLEAALPGLATVLLQGAGAQRAELWLAVEDRLVSAASCPPVEQTTPRTVANLAALLAGPDATYVMPVMDGPRLLAALAIWKDGSVTAADQWLMRDVANGASMLLRGVAQNAALEERVRRAGELAQELRASRERLTEARDVERRRLISELGNATTDRLATLRTDLLDAARALAAPELEPGVVPETEVVVTDVEPDAEAAQLAVHRARARLDELLDRFRSIARGVYPSVLRDHGPFEALDELVADLSRPVRLTGHLHDRLPWEIESGIYFLAASAMQLLAGRSARHTVELHLEHTDGRFSARITDPAPGIALDELRSSLAHDGDRLAALGGNLEVTDDQDGGAIVHAWLPDQLAPSVDLSTSVAPRTIPA